MKNLIILILFFPLVFYGQIVQRPTHSSGGAVEGIVFRPVIGGGGEEEELFTITENHTALTSVDIELAGTVGQIVNISWGDGGTTQVTLTGSLVEYTHNYSSTGTKTITLDNVIAITQFKSDNNKYSFDLADAPSGLTNISITGSNTISGDLADAPSGLTNILITGSNTISGDLADAPSGLTYMLIYGSNTISGDLGDAPSGLTYMSIQGSNTISGDLADAPSGLTFMRIVGSNTISGDLADAPSGLTNMNIQGSNTISGDLADAPSGLTNISITGSNTISGDLADAPSGLTYILISGSNTISDYTSPRTWAANMVYVLCNPAAGSGLSSSEVDNLLIDLAAASWTSTKILNIAGNNAARTSASDAAKATLIGKGVTVTVNE